MPNILVCEDHPMVIDGVKSLIARHPHYTVTGSAFREKDLLDLIAKGICDILILDLNLKKEDGFTILEKVKQLHPSIRVLILTMYDDEFIVEKARKLGAHGFILKNTAEIEFVEALEHVQNGQFYVGASIRERQLNLSRYRDTFIEKTHLTKREIEMIKLIADGKQAQEIADLLFLSLHTVNTHRKNILKKLKLNNVADLVRFAFENHLIDQRTGNR